MEIKDIFKFRWLVDDKMIFPREYKDHLKTKQQKGFYWFFKQWHTYGTGKGAVFGKFTQPFQEIFFVIAGIEFYTPFHFTVWSIGLFLLIIVILSWIFGRLYMALEIDKIEGIPPMQRSLYTDQIWQNICEKQTNEVKK